MADSKLILLGSVPAALLALGCDAALGELERTLDPTQPRRSRLRARLAVLAVVILLGFAAWGWWLENRPGESSRTTITIGSKDGSEMIILGHMLSDLVEAHTPLRVDRRFNLGGTLVCYNALRLGGLDVYVEYTGTALTTILRDPATNDPRKALDRVRSELKARDGVECLDPLGFENTFALLMRREQAERLGLRTISELGPHAGEIRPGFGPEFMNRPDGYPAIVRDYGLRFGEPPREMDRNLLYQALAQEAIDLAAGDSTDGRIDAFDLVQLEDDRRTFPPYEAVPLVRAETISKHPELRASLDLLAGRIDEQAMRRMNREVDEQKRRPEEVATEFLLRQGLLTK